MLRLAGNHNRSWKEIPGSEEEKEQHLDSEVMTYGDVSLSECELDLLRLGPGFMVVSRLEDQEMSVEASMTLTKIRWARKKMGVEGLTEEQASKEYEAPTTEEESLEDALENGMRDVVSTSGKEIDMGRRRPTDMKNNREVRMPGPAPPGVEAEYNTRIRTWQATFLDFRKKEYKDNGDQLKMNLSVSQQMGLKSLGKKVAKVEIVVLQADKGKQFVVVDKYTYLAMAMDHVSKDVETSPHDVRTSH